MDLILGFQEIGAGTILVDGKRIEDVDMRAWRSMIGYVAPGTFLVSRHHSPEHNFGRAKHIRITPEPIV